MRDPIEIGERVVDQMKKIFATMLLEWIFISLIDMDHELVDTSGTTDLLGLIFMLFLMTWSFVTIAISLSNVVRYIEPGRNPSFSVKLHAYGAWIFIAVARALSAIVAFLIVEFKLKKDALVSTWVPLLFGATGFFTALVLLFDSYVWLVEEAAGRDLNPSAASDAVRDSTPSAASDVAVLHREVLEGKRLEKARTRQLTGVVCLQ